jgi:hypothetical protein
VLAALTNISRVHCSARVRPTVCRSSARNYVTQVTVPTDPFLSQSQVRADLGDADGAERTLRDFVAEYPLNVDLNLINVFCERKMEHHQFGEVVSLIETTRGAVITSELERLKRERLERADETRIAAISSALDDTSVDQARAYLAGAYAAKRSVEESLARQKNGTTFPPELTTKLAMCLLYLNKRVEARQRLDELKKTNPSAFFDLWFDAGVACQRFVSDIPFPKSRLPVLPIVRP